MNRRAIQFAVLLSLASNAFAQEARTVDVQAAQASARAELRGQILASPVASGMTLRNAVDRDPSFSVESILDAAEQVGGPRWIEQDIVQVRMQVSASKVIERLQAVPADKRDPRLTPAEMQRLQKDWKNRSFQATGQAIPVSRIESLIAQVQTPAWQQVPQPARADAAKRASASAVATIVSSSSNIRVGPSETIDQSFTPGAQDKLAAWASSLPATKVLLRDDRQVEIGVYVDRVGLTEQIKAVVSDGVLSRSEKLQAITTGIEALPSIVVGRASVRNDETPRAGAPLVIHGLPAWVSDPLVAQGASSRGQTRLLTARQAERLAKLSLQDVIEKLEINDKTIKQHAASDSRIAHALQRAVEKARVYQVDYNLDGSAIVRVTLDPNELLDELTAIR